MDNSSWWWTFPQSSWAVAAPGLLGGSFLASIWKPALNDFASIKLGIHGLSGQIHIIVLVMGMCVYIYIYQNHIYIYIIIHIYIYFIIIYIYINQINIYIYIYIIIKHGLNNKLFSSCLTASSLAASLNEPSSLMSSALIGLGENSKIHDQTFSSSSTRSS